MIVEKIGAAAAARDVFFSFEFFPPKTAAGVENLYARMDRMLSSLRPLWVDVTWGAAGSTKELTLAIAENVQKFFGLDVLMHLTCTGLTREELRAVLEQAKAAGIRNILVLRGDPPKGCAVWEPVTGGLEHAIELVRLIKEEHGDHFCVAVAGHPEGNRQPNEGADPESSQSAGGGKSAAAETPADSQASSQQNGGAEQDGEQFVSEEELQHLKAKVDAGADFILTQFFYDVDVLLKYVSRCRAIGIECPIIPGIMPIQSYSSFMRMTRYCRTRVPTHVHDSLEPIREDDEAVRAFGVQFITDMCLQLAQAGIPGFHFYTLNLEKSVRLILNNIRASLVAAALPTPPATATAGSAVSSGAATPTAVVNGGNNTGAGNGEQKGEDVGDERGAATTTTPDAAKKNGQPHPSHTAAAAAAVAPVARRQYPWRGAGMAHRAGEEVRPINWLYRPRSYMTRTEEWDEFPNGRWGDGRSPAFGDLSDSHFFRFAIGNPDDRKAMWGEAPVNEEDVFDVFAAYVQGRIPSLPWSEMPLQPETSAIADRLAEVNRKGFLTINSQPAVNGASSDHPVFGWGPPGGLVYQKAYLEFFTSPDRLAKLLKLCEAQPSLTLYAIDHADNTYCFGVKGVTAVTWGVFPNREVQQPTVFDPETFEVWSKEAFQLWLRVWTSLYDEDSRSHELLEHMHDTYFLVAMIANDYPSDGHGSLWDLFGDLVDTTDSSKPNGSIHQLEP